MTRNRNQQKNENFNFVFENYIYIHSNYSSARSLFLKNSSYVKYTVHIIKSFYVFFSSFFDDVDDVMSNFLMINYTLFFRKYKLKP